MPLARKGNVYHRTKLIDVTDSCIAAQQFARSKEGQLNHREYIFLFFF